MDEAINPEKVKYITTENIFFIKEFLLQGGQIAERITHNLDQSLIQEAGTSNLGMGKIYMSQMVWTEACPPFVSG